MRQNATAAAGGGSAASRFVTFTRVAVWWPGRFGVLHILPAIGELRVTSIDKGRLKAQLMAKLATGLSHDTIRLIHAILRVMLDAAVEDGVILANPAAKLRRSLRFVRTQRYSQEGIKAFSREPLEVFLDAARQHEARFAPLLLLAQAGLRLGEAPLSSGAISIRSAVSSTSNGRLAGARGAVTEIWARPHDRHVTATLWRSLSFRTGQAATEERKVNTVGLTSAEGISCGALLGGLYRHLKHRV